jgi:hypothetical protein
MTIRRTYAFDGQQMALGEIAKLVPCMSLTAIRNGLAKGRTTARELLSADARRDRRSTRQGLQFGSALR